MKDLIKHLRVLISYINISWKSSIEYMNDFAIIVIDFIVTTFSTIIFWRYILGSYDQLGTWNFRELVILGIFASASWAIGSVFAGSWQISEKIVNGELDKYLCKPVNVLFALVMESMQLEEVLKGIISLTSMMIWYAIHFNTFTGVLNFVLAFVSLIIGTIIIALIRCIFSCIAFWFENTNSIDVVTHLEDFEVEKYPLQIFNKATKIIFLSLIPIGFVACVPAMIFLDKYVNKWSLLGLEVFVVVTLAFILKVIWIRGVRKYESNGG